jgi:hypothetical protein
MKQYIIFCPILNELKECPCEYEKYCPNLAKKEVQPLMEKAKTWTLRKLLRNYSMDGKRDSGIRGKAPKRWRKVKRKHSAVIQEHHISYNPEVKVTIYKGEHWLLTWMNRRRRISKGFIQALKQWILEHEKEAVELKKAKSCRWVSVVFVGKRFQTSITSTYHENVQCVVARKLRGEYVSPEAKKSSEESWTGTVKEKAGRNEEQASENIQQEWLNTHKPQTLFKIACT